ncbi:hypothetical protein [Streptomyces sp. NBC_00525]|uniref:hypothetical protein n=1 Tax=Streptomyces sp. NBC_00525 TaxID=2903660 RepID=UPI002E813026|nr:hypothetical protein [Streptomyces sp. NBC_00525]WUC92567.1 hypothetical protein OG710_02625 [Streptomyces sp. NBC_00525]
MTTAHHLRLIDGMRARAFPVERVRAGSGVSGPGYHVAHLHPEDAWDEGRDDDEADRLKHRAQCVADHEALVTLLGSRWGEPMLVSLFGARERMVSGEEIPEPWADVVAGCEFLRLWQVGERWIALALCLEEGGSGCELSVVVTETDPP